MIALALAAALTSAAAAAEPYFGLPHGHFIDGLSCSITLDGRPLHTGAATPTRRASPGRSS